MGSERCLSTLGLSSRGIDRVSLKFKLFLLHSHHDRSIRKRVVTPTEEGGLSASTAGEMYGVLKSTARAWLQKYWRDGQVGRHRGTGFWCVPAQLRMLL
jgi:hypothetical protein